MGTTIMLLVEKICLSVLYGNLEKDDTFLRHKKDGHISGAMLIEILRLCIHTVGEKCSVGNKVNIPVKESTMVIQNIFESDHSHVPPKPCHIPTLV